MATNVQQARDILKAQGNANPTTGQVNTIALGLKQGMTAPPVVAPPLLPSVPKNTVVQPLPTPQTLPPQSPTISQGEAGAVLSNPSAYSMDRVNQAKIAMGQTGAPSQLNNYSSEELYNAQLQGVADISAEYGLGDQPTTIEKQLEENKKQQEQKKAYMGQQSMLQTAYEDAQLNKAGRESTAATAGVEAAFSSGREGPQSAGSPMAVQQYRDISKQQMDMLNNQITQNRNARAQALLEYDQAIKAQNTQLAGNIKSRMVQLDQAQQEANTALIKAMSDRAQIDINLSAEERMQKQLQNTNLNSFKNFLTEGITLSPTAIKSFASDTGLDEGVLASAYLGSQAIRDDKNLSKEEKALKLQDAAVDLDRKIKGLDDVAARRAAHLQDLYKRGASAEEISAYKDAAGITDRDDPKYQAELKLTQAQTQKIEMDNRGEVPYGSTEWLERQGKALDVATKQKEFAALYGSEFDPTTFKIGEEVGWCGEYASQLSTAPQVGDMWSEKRKKIEDQNVSVGDKLLMPGGQYGHVAVVIGYEPATGEIKVAESNRDGRQNKGSGLGIATFGTYNVNDLNIKYGNDWGVAHGELKPKYRDAQVKPELSDKGLYNDSLNIAKEEGLSGKDAEEFAKTRVKESYAPLSEGQARAFTAYNKLKPENDTYEEITKEINQEDFADTVDVISRKVKDDNLTAQVINKYVEDPVTRRAIMSEMRWIEGALRKASGAAITGSEYSTYGTMYFPRRGDDAKTLEDKKQRRLEQAESLVGEMGPGGQRLLKKDTKPEENTDPLSIFSGIKPKTDPLKLF